MRAIRASVVCMPTWSRVSVPKACQLFIFTCHSANKCATVPEACQFFNLASQYFNLASQRAKRYVIYSTSPTKRCANFLTIFQKNYIFFKYLMYLYLIYFIYFVYLKYITNIYFYMNIFLSNFISRV